MPRILVALFLALPAVAQQPASYILRGYLGVTGGESFTYRLEFKDSASYINGYSYTYMWEKNEIKANISGRIDRANKTITFQETGIVYNHGFESNTTICLLDATLSYRPEGTGMILTGAFKSADAGNVYCGKGTLSFTGNAIIDNLFALKADAPAAKPVVAAPPVLPKPGKQNPVRIIYDTLPKKKEVIPLRTATADGPEKITAGTEKTYEWNTDVVSFSIWDGGRIDGDVVSILFDDQVVAKNYPLVAERKSFSFRLPDNKVHTLTIIANNEGGELPNTANIELRDGMQVHHIIAYNPIAKRAVIRIRKK